ncbi:hypothetical protein [Paenibacillus ginsengarvi]|uniref:Uncharacterized protein n=1 Tax=Paenibacillus ginsengarvi TaxID=400777 RepID=A0A3B0CJ30_9BACL|nr:hypothetical protein [Paenibacillus ginsengarvi]RKN84584.1 hypothetical protein D7M11_11330 [Paenibacillus ginsengarvi]
MKTLYRVLIASILCIGVASALSIVLKLDAATGLGKTETPAFRADSPLVLSDRNLVDIVAKLTLHLDIASVEWNNTILSVDLRSKPDDAAMEPIYDDLYDIASLGFAGTKNVKQILVRVMEPPATGVGAPQLLLAMDAKRSDLGGGTPEAALQRKGTKEQFLSSHFSLTYTHKWLDRHRR